MHETAPRGVETARLPGLIRAWINDGRGQRLTRRSLEARDYTTRLLIRYLCDVGAETCGRDELRDWLAHLAEEVKPSTSRTYHGTIRALMRWLVDEGVLPTSPMEGIRPPIDRADQVYPFSPDQVTALLLAAQHSRHPKRDLAILLLLADTGMRASELCHLRARDLDLTARRARVLGKGQKERSLPFGRRCARTLYAYLSDQPRERDEPLFVADRGPAAGDGLTRSGLLQLFERLGEVAGIHRARCSPHTMRHTFAIEYLRGGGNVISLQEILGHTSLKMVQRYVNYAQADLDAQHRLAGPVDRLWRR